MTLNHKRHFLDLYDFNPVQWKRFTVKGSYDDASILRQD